MIKEFPNKPEDDKAIEMRMDLSFDVPEKFAEQIEMWGIHQFEYCKYDRKRRRFCLSASTKLYKRGA